MPALVLGVAGAPWMQSLAALWPAALMLTSLALEADHRRRELRYRPGAYLHDARRLLASEHRRAD